MQVISREALPRPATPKGVNSIWATKWAFIYVKRAKAKNSVISYLRVPTVRNGQCKQFYARFYERGNNIWATKLAFIYVKMTQAKNSVTPYILRFP